MSILKEHLEFPQDFTFKVIGDNTPHFEFDVEEIFVSYPERIITAKISANQKYISYSVAVRLESYEELEALYAKISALRGLKFYC